MGGLQSCNTTKPSSFRKFSALSISLSTCSAKWSPSIKITSNLESFDNILPALSCLKNSSLVSLKSALLVLTSKPGSTLYFNEDLTA